MLKRLLGIKTSPDTSVISDAELRQLREVKKDLRDVARANAAASGKIEELMKAALADVARSNVDGL